MDFSEMLNKYSYQPAIPMMYIYKGLSLKAKASNKDNLVNYVISCKIYCAAMTSENTQTAITLMSSRTDQKFL